MSGFTCVITLGRNIGDKPMSRKDWHSYRARVWSLIEAQGGNVIQRPQMRADVSHEQVGVWDGHVEYACTFVALFAKNRRAYVAEELTRLCQDYRQDCIGLIWVKGSRHLIYGGHTL